MKSTETTETKFTVDVEYERRIKEAATSKTDLRDLRYMARLTLYRLPIDECRKVFCDDDARRRIDLAFIDATIDAQNVSRGGKACRFPMRDILTGDFFPFDIYRDDAPYAKSLRKEYERQARFAISVGYGEQIDAYAEGVPATFIFQ